MYAAQKIAAANKFTGGIMEINQTSTGISSQISSSSITQNFSGSSPAKVAGDINGLLAYYDPDKPQELERSPKEYAKKLEHFESVKGYFNFYFHKDTNTALMEVNSKQLEKVFLLSAYRITEFAAAEARPDCMLANYPVYFKRAGNNIQLYIKKVDSRSDNSNLAKAIDRNENDTLLASAKISMTDGDKILFDLKDLVVIEAERLLADNPRILNNFKIDKENSFLAKPKSFSKNSEIKTTLVYAPNTDPESLKRGNTPVNNINVDYNISFSELPERGYIPRVADKRIGYFTTDFDNYNKVVTDENEKRRVEYIQRWNLGKIDPVTKKPERPILFWVSNTVPAEYKEAVKKGILAWNKAFEEIGIKDAIQVELQPDNAEWDSSDIRYNTVNFIHYPRMSGAMGPSQVDPFTGEIYAADVLIDYNVLNSISKNIPLFDNNYLALKDEKSKKEYIEKCVQGFLASLTFHEIGHTLGLRHNFKGSLKKENGVPCSVMDYNPEDDGAHQSEPGVYDKKAIEYGYKPLYSKTPQDEKKALEKIVRGMYEKNIPYGTDEDAWYGIDPSCNQHDDGNPLEYSREKLKRSRALLARIEKEFEKPGTEYEKLEHLLRTSLGNSQRTMKFALKYLGGVYYNYGNVGDLDGKNPYEPVPAKEQKDALKFLLEELLSAETFNISPSLISKLNFPIKDAINGFQLSVLDAVFSVEKLKQIERNEDMYKNDPFKLSDLFEIVNKNLCLELDNKENITISETRQEFQIAYVKKLSGMAKGIDKMPRDVASLAKKTLSEMEDKINYVMEKEKHNDIKIDKNTAGFLRELLDLIKKSR